MFYGLSILANTFSVLHELLKRSRLAFYQEGLCYALIITSMSVINRGYVALCFSSQGSGEFARPSSRAGAIL